MNGESVVESKPGACLAVNFEQAVGIAYAAALREMARESGYHSHSVAVMEIPVEMIAAVVEVAANV